MVCGLDSDSDGYPDVQLDCTGPQCEQVHNKKKHQISLVTLHTEFRNLISATNRLHSCKF